MKCYKLKVEASTEYAYQLSILLLTTYSKYLTNWQKRRRSVKEKVNKKRKESAILTSPTFWNAKE